MLLPERLHKVVSGWEDWVGDNQHDQVFARRISLPDKHMAKQSVPGILIKGPDLKGLQQTPDADDDAVTHLILNHTAVHRNNHMGVLFIDSGNRVSLPVMRKYSMHLAPIMERCLHSDDGVNPAHGVLQQIADVCILFLELELIGHSLIIAAAALLRMRTDILLFCGCMAVSPAFLRRLLRSRTG